MRIIAAGLVFVIISAFISGGLRAETANWQAQPVRLMIVEQEGYVACEKWRQEIGPGYATSRAGRVAPLLRVNIDGPWPDGIALAHRPTVTPTFILLENGFERARLEGYPGAYRFYPLITQMLDQAGIAR